MSSAGLNRLCGPDTFARVCLCVRRCGAYHRALRLDGVKRVQDKPSSPHSEIPRRDLMDVSDAVFVLVDAIVAFECLGAFEVIFILANQRYHSDAPKIKQRTRIRLRLHLSTFSSKTRH